MRDGALHCPHFASAPCTSVSLSSPKLVSKSATTKFDGDCFTSFVNWKAGGPCEPPAVKVIYVTYYWLGPLLAASACCIFFPISAFTASRLKLAPSCIGG